MKCCYMVTRSLPPGSVNAHLSNYTGQSKCGWQHIVIINVLYYAACQTQWLFTESFQHNPHILNWQIYSNLINDTGIIGIIQPIISIIIFVPALFGLSIWGYFAWCLHLSPQSPSIDWLWSHFYFSSYILHWNSLQTNTKGEISWMVVRWLLALPWLIFWSGHVHPCFFYL